MRENLCYKISPITLFDTSRTCWMETSQSKLLEVNFLDLQGHWVPPSIDTFLSCTNKARNGMYHFTFFSFKPMDALWQTVCLRNFWSLETSGSIPQLHIFLLISTVRQKTDVLRGPVRHCSYSCLCRDLSRCHDSGVQPQPSV